MTTCGNSAVKAVLQTPRSDVLYKEVTVSPSHALIVEIPHTLMLRGTERAYKSLRFVSLFSYTMKLYTVFNLATWPRMVGFTEFIIRTFLI